MVSSALVLLILASPAGTGSAADNALTWIHDDYAAARADAKRAGRPIFVDVWATWCHTCLAMKNFVLPDPRLKPERKAYTWLALDFDNERNSDFFAKFPVNAVPTFFILSADGQVRGRKIGATSLPEMQAFLAGGHDALMNAERLLAAGDYTAAAKAFAAIRPPPEVSAAWRTRRWAGTVEALWRTDEAACAQTGIQALPDFPASGGSIETISIMLGCIESLPRPQKMKAARAVRDRLESWAARDDVPLSGDDRSTLFGLLIDTAHLMDDTKAVNTYWARRKAVLERAAASAPTPAARATYDAHRLDVYMQLGETERALRMLEASEAAQPDDFNHPWRQAQVYLQQRNFDKGLAAIDRALNHGYGGRKLRLYATKLDLLIGAGRWKAAQQTAAEGHKTLRGLHPSQVRQSWRTEFESRANRVHAHFKG